MKALPFFTKHPPPPADCRTFADLDSPERAQQLRKMRIVDRIASIDKIHVFSPPVAALWGKLHDYRGLRAAGGSPRHVLLTGVSGTGKTTMIEWYISENPRRKDAERWVIPCFRAAVPDSPTRETLVGELLSCLGDQMSGKGSVEDRTRRLHRYIELCSVELICLDNVHRLIDPEKGSVIPAVKEWLSRFAEESKAIILMAGWPQTISVKDTDEKLSELFSDTVETGPLAFRERNGRPSIRDFIRSVEDQLPLAQASRLWTDDQQMAARMFYATDGYACDVMRLLTVATKIAIEGHIKKIGLETLRSAWDQSLTTEKPHKTNAFKYETFTADVIRLLSENVHAAGRISIHEANIRRLSQEGA
jgi:hypothetical protein